MTFSFYSLVIWIIIGQNRNNFEDRDREQNEGPIIHKELVSNLLHHYTTAQVYGTGRRTAHGAKGTGRSAQ